MRMPALLAAAALLACGDRAVFRQEEIDAARLGSDFPAGFLLGAASSSHQIEGGQDNDWTVWERESYPDGQPHIMGDTPSGRAAGSWTLWPEDVRALRQLGANAYRFSVEWSRLEPAPGAWDSAAVANYRAQLAALRAQGITPMVTIQHVTLPRWFADRGGWEWDGAIEVFAQFAGRVARELGDLVDLWCTINEINVAAYEAYLAGIKPPGVRDSKRMTHVYARLLRAHGASAASVRANDQVDADGDGAATQVGVAHMVVWFEPASWHPMDTTIAAATDDFFNEAIPRAVKTGRIRLSVPMEIDLDEPAPELVGTFDFLGLNYYRRDHLRFDPASPELATTYVPLDLERSGLGWEIYPEGLYRALVRFSKYGWPIYVTENGVADATGELRPGYLERHVWAVSRARAEGAEVRGYFHWSLIDNFEWTDGYIPESRFGLFAIDFDDPALTRRPTPAVETFRRVARNMGLTPADP